MQYRKSVCECGTCDVLLSSCSLEQIFPTFLHFVYHFQTDESILHATSILKKSHLCFILFCLCIDNFLAHHVPEVPQIGNHCFGLTFLLLFLLYLDRIFDKILDHDKEADDGHDMPTGPRPLPACRPLRCLYLGENN